VLTGADDEAHAVLLALLQRFVKIRFPIRHVNPLAASGRSPRPFERGGPGLGFARTTQPFAARFTFGCRPGAATFLPEQSQHRSFGPLRQRPGLNAHRQRAVQFKAAPATISHHPQILRGRPPAVIQLRRILDQQILAGLAARRPGAFQMRRENALKTHAALAEEAIGRLEFRPVRKGLWQCAAW
jgi:hypothetical protein